jgi:hypothetical protein
MRFTQKAGFTAELYRGTHHRMKAIDAENIVRLAEVADISAGHPLRSGVDDLAPGGVAVVQMRNVDPDRGVDWAGLAAVELPPARKTDFLKRGDVIFSTRGARNYGVVLAVVPVPAVCSPHFFVIRTRSRRVDPDFLAWQINQAPAQEYFQREATGSHILNIKREVLERLEVVVPPLAQQVAIAAFAEAARWEKQLMSALIDNRQKQMNALAAGLRHSIKE